MQSVSCVTLLRLERAVLGSGIRQMTGSHCLQVRSDALRVMLPIRWPARSQQLRPRDLGVVHVGPCRFSDANG